MGGKWGEAPLSELTDPNTPVTYGVVKPGPEDPNGVLFIRGGDIADGRVLTDQLRTITRDVSEQYRRTLLQGGEIVVSLVGNPGQVAIIPSSLKGANIARQAGLVRLRQDVDARFVKYFLSSRIGREALGAHSLGSVQQVINLRDLKTVLVPTPPLPEQRAIAHILGTLDDKIELNRRMNETLEAMARALFKSWFVDFDPVRAKCRGEPACSPQSGHTPQSGQAHRPAPTKWPQHILDLFPDRFVDSELGEIPEGWEVRPIGEIVQVLGGGTPSTKQYRYWDGGEHSFCTPKDMSGLSSSVLSETERHLTGEGVARVSSGVLPTGTVLLSSRAPIGYLAIAEVPVSVNQGIIAMVCNRVLPNLYVLLWTRTNMDLIESNANGSTFQEISKKNFRPIPAVIPSKPVLNQFMTIVRPYYEHVALNVSESRTLTSLRDTLLPKLISGELRVKDAQKFIGRVS